MGHSAQLKNSADVKSYMAREEKWAACKNKHSDAINGALEWID